MRGVGWRVGGVGGGIDKIGCQLGTIIIGKLLQ